MANRHVFAYGEHPSRLIQVWQPDDDAAAPFPMAVLLHGGWWRDAHDLRLMDGLAAALADSGRLVWNVEYRRTGDDGGGWPQTLEDVQAALNLLGDRLREGAEPGDPHRVVGIGHSAGGHLALLAAAGSPLTGVIGLAPVTDLRAAATAGLGEGAVADFLGAAPADSTYTEAAPLHRLPIGVPQLIVHGDADRRVPVEHSRAYAEAARAAGDPVEYAEIAGADHFAVVDPQQQAWRSAGEWLQRAGV
ncbi:alpha/beta hydrolase family protein [Streptomonospora litoralis]|uniref:Alpha/beta hydrolase family protein n=1 Tax=Streptomonospora litoralis TaxID=2498135 RepID=A0A4P6Q0V6_9ACTN|nr:alpha/beta hydrolase [Streptomonospora litoralis]QBI54073.1 Alpha/beta hydrolase family protein [Streptomonospora litoralis]